MNFLSDPPPSDTETKRDEKEERIAEFISYYVERLAVTDPSDTYERAVTLVAQSPSSPVAQAVASCMPELIAAGVSFQVIFARLEPSDALSQWIDPELSMRSVFAENQMAGIRVTSIRHASNPCLAEAHEQLTLGSEMSWAGDSMRRDTGKRDAFECYDIDGRDSVDLARRSFTRLWQVTTPLETSTASSRQATGSPSAPSIGEQNSATGEKPARTNKSPSAPSRH